MISLRNLFLSIKNPQTKYRMMKHFEQYGKCFEKNGLYNDFNQLRLKPIY